MATQLGIDEAELRALQNDPQRRKKEMRKLKRQHHPDKNIGMKEEAEAKFKLIPNLEKLLEDGLIDAYLSEYHAA